MRKFLFILVILGALGFLGAIFPKEAKAILADYECITVNTPAYAGGTNLLPSIGDYIDVRVTLQNNCDRAISMTGRTLTMTFSIDTSDINGQSTNTSFYNQPSAQTLNETVSAYGESTPLLFRTTIKDGNTCSTSQYTKANAKVTYSDGSTSSSSSNATLPGGVGSKVHGTVYTSTGVRAAGATVTITPADNAPNGGATTADASGNYTFTRIACTAQHTIQASLSGETTSVTLDPSYGGPNPVDLCNGRDVEQNITLQPNTAPPSNPTNLTRNVSSACTDNYYSADFSWTLPAGVTKTEFRLQDITNYAPMLVFSWNQPIVGVTVTNLAPGITYRWWVRVGNANGFSDWVQGQDFSRSTCPKPDLIIEGMVFRDSTGTNRTTFAPGETVYVAMTILNQGNGNAGSFNTVYRVGADFECNPERYQQKLSLSSLAAGSRYTFDTQFSFTASGSGTKTVYAMVDGYCTTSVSESNENNNRLTRSFEVAQPDLVVSSIRLSDTSGNTRGVFAPGQHVNVTIVIQNIGGLEVNNTFRTYYRVNTDLNACNPPQFQEYKDFTGTLASQGVYSFTTFNGFNASSTVGTYTVRALVDGSGAYSYCSVNESNEGNNILDKTYQVAETLRPANLEVSSSCGSDGLPRVTFTWDDALGETWYILRVNDEEWDQSGFPTGYYATSSVTQTPADTTSFTWSGSNPMNSGPLPRTPASNTTYWWLLITSDGSVIKTTYPTDDPPDYTVAYLDLAPSGPPGTAQVPFTTPDCRPDLAVSLKNPNPNPTLVNAGQSVTFTFVVTNIGPSNVGGNLGFWKEDAAWTASGANCPSIPGSPEQQRLIGSLAPGASLDITFTFTASTTPNTYTAYAYAITNCALDEKDWSNNLKTQTYKVQLDSWFETGGGDVGSRGTIAVSQPSPAGRYQSDYLLAALNVDSSTTVAPTGWKITDYDKPLVAARPYDYLAERFIETAIPQGGDCIQSDSPQLTRCTGPVPWTGGGILTGSHAWFIDGDLVISGDLRVGSGANDTAVFIVSGNVTVNTTNVTRADGIYVVGGTYMSTTDTTNVTGNQLRINGGIYATTLNLSRKLSADGATCGGVACSNLTDPAEKITYEPKYLISLKDLLGSPGVAWKEVAP